jgi:hypothetical protein
VEVRRRRRWRFAGGGGGGSQEEVEVRRRRWRFAGGGGRDVFSADSVRAGLSLLRAFSNWSISWLRFMVSLVEFSPGRMKE